jgi:hypothetical protein
VGHEPEAEVLVDRGRVERGVDLAVLQQRLDLGGEDESPVLVRVVERLLAEAVAPEQ